MHKVFSGTEKRCLPWEYVLRRNRTDLIVTWMNHVCFSGLCLCHFCPHASRDHPWSQSGEVQEQTSGEHGSVWLRKGLAEAVSFRTKTSHMGEYEVHHHFNSSKGDSWSKGIILCFVWPSSSSITVVSWYMYLVIHHQLSFASSWTPFQSLHRCSKIRSNLLSLVRILIPPQTITFPPPVSMKQPVSLWFNEQDEERHPSPDWTLPFSVVLSSSALPSPCEPIRGHLRTRHSVYYS